jgi:metal-responsive CopG/Arc/MetJ family transcriptional regulator
MCERMIPVSVSMPAGLARRIRVLAAKQDKSRSEFVREIMERVVDRSDDSIDENQGDDRDET